MKLDRQRSQQLGSLVQKMFGDNLRHDDPNMSESESLRNSQS